MKLSIESLADGDTACLRFAGTIDEEFAGAATGGAVPPGTGALVLDLGGVKKISSFGIREWVDFLAAARQRAREVVLVECAPKVVDQMNMVANFAQGARVYSVYAPFRCDFCDAEHRVLLQVDRDADAIKAMKVPPKPCPTCKQPLYFDDDGATFFSYLATQPRVELPPAVSSFLTNQLGYALADGSRKLRVDKIVDERATYLGLAGDLDSSFPADKLADGLEGEVFCDVSGIANIDPPGAAAWRAFVQLVSPHVEKLYVAGASSVFRDRLASVGGDLGPRGMLLELAANAGELRARLDRLRDKTAVSRPSLMPRRRSPSTARITPSRPSLPPQPGGSQPFLTAPAPAAAPRRTALWVPVVAALIALGLAGGAIAIYLFVAGVRHAAKPGDIDAQSITPRPAWLVDHSSCVAAGSGLSCVGVSSPRAAQDDAEDEAADAAYDELATAIATRITAKPWHDDVQTVYAAARDAKLAAFARDPSNTVARRAVLEARHAVTQLLRATGAAAVPAAPSAHYWERRITTGTDKAYVASAQLVIAGADLARLVARYQLGHAALGTSAMTAFPSLGWRYPRFQSGGAIVVGVAEGALQSLGLAKGYIVVAVDGRPVADADVYGTFVEAEQGGASTHGGTLRLEVIAGDDGAPREFARTYAGPEPANLPVRYIPVPSVPTGGINVWDRYGGSK